MKLRERRKGQGSVYQRSTDNRWVASATLPRGEDGKRRRKVAYGVSRDDALNKLDALLGPELPPPVRESTARDDRMWVARRRATHTPEEWAAVLEIADGHCFYCGEQGPLEQDHMVPIGRGGSNSIENVVPSCRPCNGLKRARTAVEFHAWLRTRPSVTTQPEET